MAKNDKTKPSFDARILEASAEHALHAIREAGERAEALVEAWVAAGNAAAVQEVGERGSGAARKAARRGLNVLRSRRVPIPPLLRVAALPAS